MWTPEGLGAIETLKPGDVVLAADLETGEIRECRVLAVSRNEQRQTVSLTTGDETLAATPNHLVWVENTGWTNAGALVSGATILLLDGSQPPSPQVPARFRRLQQRHTSLIFGAAPGRSS